jgi:hypothetical protein
MLAERDDATCSQAIFLAGCRDEVRLIAGVDQLFDWLGLAKLEHLVSVRAQARTQVLEAISKVHLGILATP